MAYFYIDTAKAIENSLDIVSTAKKLNAITNDLRNVKLDGILDVSSRRQIDKALKELREKAASEAAKMSSLGEALQSIANTYRETEKSVKNAAEQGDPSAQRGTDKRNLWGKFWDWIKKEEPDEYDTTTLEQEKAADEAMKQELWVILQDEKYSPETWDKASLEERKKILQDYMDEVIKIYGLQDVNPKIKWNPKATYSEERIEWGSYHHGLSHTVTLNEQALSDRISGWDSYDLLETVSHELRHAYQHEAVDHPTRYMVSKETIDTWKDNLRNYISSDKNYPGYRAQPVEVDARDFQVSRNKMP